jgi:hypothetical protein
MAVLENRPSKTLRFLHVFSSENHFFNTLLGRINPRKYYLTLGCVVGPTDRQDGPQPQKTFVGPTESVLQAPFDR